MTRRDDGRVSARLRHRHPRLGAVAGAAGDSEQEALERLHYAVTRFGSDWPMPPPREQRQYRVQDSPVPVVLAYEGRHFTGWAVAWTQTEVWVSWEQAPGHDRAEWVPADHVARLDLPGP